MLRSIDAINSEQDAITNLVETVSTQLAKVLDLGDDTDEAALRIFGLFYCAIGLINCMHGPCRPS